MALDYCHANGVLHLDVKPANIMVKMDVGKQKWIKLGDFGNSVSLQQLDSFQVTFLCPEFLFLLIILIPILVPTKSRHSVLLCTRDTARGNTFNKV